MEKFTTHSGTAVPFRRNNVDTDQILPAQYLKRITRTGFEDGLFHSWRKHPDFILNQPTYQGASVLLAGSNFGIGSSREHAVWALLDYGFKVVVSTRFGDIFKNNAGKAGLLVIEVGQAELEKLWALVEATPMVEVCVDLTARKLRVQDVIVAFAIDDYTRWALLEGLDDIDLTLAHTDDISTYEVTRHSWMPTSS